MSATKFIAWLQEELQRRGWGQAELARRSRMSTAQISRIMTGENQAGPDSCVKIARAFKFPPEKVFRQAGLLPPNKSVPEGTDEVMYYYTNLSDDDRRKAVALLRALFELTDI